MRRCLLLLSSALCLLVLPALASAAEGWSNPVLADPSFNNSFLYCASSSHCLAVSRHAEEAAYENSQWTVARIINSAEIRGLSCASLSSCVAVDNAGDAVVYNGSAWSRQVIDAGKALNGVSCYAAGDCLVVTAKGEAIFERNGAWSAPTEIDESRETTAVSCSGEDFCMAVDAKGHALSYNGNSWSTLKIDNVAALKSVSCVEEFCAAGDALEDALVLESGVWSAPYLLREASPAAKLGEVSSIVCKNRNFCIAVTSVGYADYYEGHRWEHYSGSKWEYEHFKTPAPLSKTTQSGFTSLTCSSTTFCAAANAEARIYALPNPTSGAWEESVPLGSGGVTSVSCDSKSFCAAVDAHGRYLTYSGSGWSAPTSVGSLHSEVADVSCSGGAFCQAVGEKYLSYNGTSWEEVAGPPKGGGVNSSKGLSVSCPLVAFCAEVAEETEEVQGNEFTRTPIHFYRAGAWGSREKALPSVLEPASKGNRAFLKAISCVSEDFCMAAVEDPYNPTLKEIGEEDEKYKYYSAVEYTGSSWTNEIEGKSNLSSLEFVSCPTDAFCSVSTPASNNFLYSTLHTPGGEWTLPLRIETGTIKGLSCASSAFCAAVDVSGRAVIYFSGREEAWGKPYQVTRATALNEETQPGFAAVSCPLEEYCVAFDDEGNALTYSPSSLPRGTTPPTISGEAIEADTFTATHATWTLPPSSYLDQWESCNAAGEGCVPIEGANSTSFTVQGLTHHRLRFREVAVNAFGESNAAYSSLSGEIESLQEVLPHNNSAPAVTGSLAIGATLSATTGEWSGRQPLTYTYQWEACASTCVEIPGATSSTYVIPASDGGDAFRVKVTASNSLGSTSVLSATTTHLPLSKETHTPTPTPTTLCSATSSQLRTLLLRVTLPTGKKAKIAALLKAGSYTSDVALPCAGNFTGEWREVVKLKHKKKRYVNVATATVHAVSVGSSLPCKIQLTAAGKSLLKHARSSSLEINDKFVPQDGATVTANKTFILKR